MIRPARPAPPGARLRGRKQRERWLGRKPGHQRNAGYRRAGYRGVERRLGWVERCGIVGSWRFGRNRWREGARMRAATLDATGAVEAGPFTLTSTAYSRGNDDSRRAHLCGSEHVAAARMDRSSGGDQELRAGLYRQGQRRRSRVHSLGPVGHPGGNDVASRGPRGRYASRIPRAPTFDNGPGYAGPCPGAQRAPLHLRALPDRRCHAAQRHNNGDLRPNLVTAIKMHQWSPPAHLDRNAQRPSSVAGWRPPAEPPPSTIADCRIASELRLTRSSRRGMRCAVALSHGQPHSTHPAGPLRWTS